MNEFDMGDIPQPGMPKKSIVLTVTLELEDASKALNTLQSVEDAVGEGADIIGFNLFDSYRSLF